MAAHNHMIDGDIAKWMGWVPPIAGQSPEWWTSPGGKQASQPPRYTSSLDLLLPVMERFTRQGFTVALSTGDGKNAVTVFNNWITADREANTLALACARALHALIDRGTV